MILNKKTVSVLGCCMSRNIFNAPQVKNIFDVKRFAFQVVPWSLFDEALHIPYAKFEKIVNSPFEQRILDYNLNKSVISHFENEKTDYIAIDLIACSFVLYEIFFDGKSTIVRMGHGDKSLDKMKSDDYFAAHGFSYRKLSYKSVAEEKVRKGMEYFINWLDRTYSRERIIICKPMFPDRYLNKDLQLCCYDEKKKKQYEEDERFVSELTKDILEKLKGCLVYEYPEDMIAEEYAFKESLPFHQTNMDYIRQGDNLLKLLEIDYKDYYCEALEPTSYLMESWCKKYCDARKMLVDMESLLLGTEIKDYFSGTSVSSVSTQPFGKGLIRVKEVADRVEKQKIATEGIWYEKYMKLREDCIKLEEEIFHKKIHDFLKEIPMKEARNIVYNQGLIDVNQLISFIS